MRAPRMVVTGALAVLLAILGNHRELSEVGGRVLTVSIAAMAGALGFEMGNLVGKKDSE